MKGSMGVALYRKYRSRTLDDVVGQEHVTTLLKNALNSGHTAHAYLFTGPRGVGKTSIARIMAHELNQLPYDGETTHLDIIEIDAASNNGVEDIRELRERVQIAPVNARKKVYIIDEVHMLSKQAFNALLKTLEEPPEHVVFILATTDIDKVPETIISRTQRHTFRRASYADIVKNLQRIASHEKVTADEDALQLIARHADGSFRDSISLFDQLLSGTEGNHLTAQNVTSSLGLVTDDTVRALVDATLKGDISTINNQLNDLESAGIPPRTTAAQLTDFLRRHLVEDSRYTALIDSLLEVGKSHYPELKLLTSLGLFTQPDSAARQATPSISKPSVTSSIPASTTPHSSRLETKKKSTHKAAHNKEVEVSNQQPSSVPASQKRSTAEFDWQTFVSHVKTHHIALHSVLSKCEPETDETTLRLYTKSAFYKKKLDDLRFRTLLLESLAELGYEFEIEIVATAKPLKDSQAAQVAAIMGGGEEVSVEDA
jgi:DNA polymerase-3 subunit gamma/tau